MNKEDELKSLQEEETNLRNQLGVLEKRIHEIELCLCPVHVGDLVRAITEPPSGVLLVSDVDTSMGLKKPWVKARMRKKDGRWGDRQVCLYDDWELAEEERP